MKKEQSIKKHIEKIVNPIFQAALPKETLSNSMTTTKPIKIFFRPNNYRRKIAVKEKTDSTISFIKKTLGLSKNFKYTDHTKMISVKNYMGITIQYGKNHITGIFSQNVIHGHKEIYLIEAHSKTDIETRIRAIRGEIRRKIDISIFHFIKSFNLHLKGVTRQKPIWDRYEDFIKGEEYIDKIPRDVIIHDTFFKKVYGKGIEFKQTDKKEAPGVHLKNYIVNQSIKDREPLIAKEINNIFLTIAPTLTELNSSIQLEITNKKLHLGVLKDMSKTLKQIRGQMSQKKLTEY